MTRLVTDRYGVITTTGVVGSCIDFDGIDDGIYVSSKNALNFNGTSDYVGPISGTQFYLNNKDKSIEAWIKIESTGAYNMICRKWNDWDLRLSSGSATFVYWNDNNWSEQYGQKPSLNVWHHFVGVYESGVGAKLYLDGSEIGSDVKTGTDSNTSNVHIGYLSGATPQYYFDGIIDEIRIWNKVLTAGSITTLYNNGNILSLGSETGIVAGYNFNLSGTVISDYSGFNATGTNNGASWDSGKEDFLNIPTGSISISAWINIGSILGPSRRIIDKPYTSRVEPYTQYALITETTAGSKPQFELTINGTRRDVSGTTVISSGTWYHIVGTYDGNWMKIYVNNVLEASGNYTGSISTYNTQLWIGRYEWTPTDICFIGKIDEVGVFNTVLDSNEIGSLYNYGSGLFIDSSFSAWNDAVAIFHLDESGIIITDTKNNLSGNTSGGNLNWVLGKVLSGTLITTTTIFPERVINRII